MIYPESNKIRYVVSSEENVILSEANVIPRCAPDLYQ